MGINKVQYGNTTLIDLTSDTVTPSVLMEGYTAHDRSGAIITGTATGGGTGAISVVDTTDTHGGTIRTITAVDISDTTAVAEDVAQGKYFYTADGTKTVGTSSGGGGDESLIRQIILRTITDITFPSDIVMIGDYAFANCTYFNPSSLPNTVTSIKLYSFYNCKALALTNLPNNLTYIGDYAFNKCSALALTTLPSGVIDISAHAFDGCTNLALTSLSNDVSYIRDYAFNGCENISLTSLPSGITIIPIYAFADCYRLALTSLPDGLISIGNYAFNACENITSISCAGRITTLGYYAFNGDALHPMKLASVSFPNMSISTLYTTFGHTTANNACKLLKVADIGSTKTIGANAFNNCNSLDTLILRRSDAICTMQNPNAFTNTPMRGYNSLTGTVYVPQALISAYQTATNWSTLYNDGMVTFVAIEGSEYDLS